MKKIEITPRYSKLFCEGYLDGLIFLVRLSLKTKTTDYSKDMLIKATDSCKKTIEAINNGEVRVMPESPISFTDGQISALTTYGKVCGFSENEDYQNYLISLHTQKNETKVVKR